MIYARRGRSAINWKRPEGSFLAFIALLAVAWIAGGSARAEVSGQIVIQSVSWALLIALVIFGTTPDMDRYKPIMYFLLAIVILSVFQLIPLPIDLWSMLPGRETFYTGISTLGLEGEWRPISLVPGATFTTLCSLVVPLAALIIFTHLKEESRLRLPGAILIFIAFSAILALIELSGASFDNPFVNDTAWHISANFANRNHLALFLAFGCLLAPSWAFSGYKSAKWRFPFSIALVSLFMLVIIGTGSRTGLFVGILALFLSGASIQSRVRATLGKKSRVISLALMAVPFMLIAILVIVSFFADRAFSIERVHSLNAAEDLRLRAWPTVVQIAWSYFPIGAGLGSFDPIFRVDEPIELLNITFFNHAHNDFLQVLIEGGMFGAFLGVASIVWWSIMSVRAWQKGQTEWLPRVGSSMLLLIFVASISDYPARTPVIIIIAVVAAVWLAGGRAAIQVNKA